ncbi:MAG TPA: ABC transporter ATP-binding protein [Acidimicrobiales bacterium]|nr:ABC transporter ATP-binding protein [Acidimicrobiales bacterium]
MAAIEIDRLTKRFGDRVAVDDLSFSVDAGTVTGFLGPNGAGKTTTLRALLGLVRPNSGAALVNGKPFVDLPAPHRTVGALLEASAFHPGRRGRDHLRILARAMEVPERRVDDVLELTGIADAAHTRVGAYSMGMRQRLGLAGALLADPAVLILDEPANGLDPAGIRWLRDLLRWLAEQGRTVLVSSHVLSEVNVTADRVVIVAQGRLVAESSIAELTARAKTFVRVRSPHLSALGNALSALPGASVDYTSEPGCLQVTGVDSAAIGQAAADARLVLHELTTVTSSLEDVFFSLVGGGPTS